MEAKSAQCLVRELDLTLQPRIAPRYKTWLPLATQQLRLRSLVRVIGHNLKTDERYETCWFYYTLHRSGMSSPFFTSELVDNVGARWASLEVSTVYATGLSAASEIVVRLWRRTVASDGSTDATVFAWGISFTGLAYMGARLPARLDKTLRDNSLIFHLHGGYFAPSYCLVDRPDNKRYLRISVRPSEIRESYTVVKLTSLRSKMQALKQQTESVQSLRERIASGDEVKSPRYKQTSLNRLLQPKRLGREKKAEILRMRKELEIAKFRTKLLEQERIRKMGETRSLNQLHTSIAEENQDHGSDLMERYRELNKDIERLREWRQGQAETRELCMQTSSKLAHRRRQLISELALIYPICQESEKKYRINNVHLPDSEELESSNDTQVSVALGFVAHTTQMIANFLNVPPRYPILHYGSRSRVVDHITDSLPDNERQFPLFARTKDKLQFNYAVYLMNKNIAQLRWYCGLPTADLRATLANLTSLIVNTRGNQPLDNGSERTFSGSSLDTDLRNVKQNAPLTPPCQRVMFEKCPRASRSTIQAKSGLGSSLDQGLDKPPDTLFLTKTSKRVCKSEESAIDDKRSSSLPRETTSSQETLDDTVFEKSVASLSRETSRCSRLMASIGDIERDIEIVTPVSVSTEKTCSETTEDSSSTKHRSSNSISSCEMALGGSQNDIGETSLRSSADREGSSTNGQYPPTFDDEQSDDKSPSSSTSLGTADRCTLNERGKSQDTLTEIRHNESSNLESKIAVNSEETLSNSCASLDAVQTRNYHCKETSLEAVCGGASSYPENRDSGMARLTLRAYESDGKLDTKNHFHRPGAISRAESSTSSEEASEYSQLLDETRESSKFISHARGNKDQEVASEFRTSTDYINSIRRSSENVFARTEALASKKTSFKVMKPRM